MIKAITAFIVGFVACMAIVYTINTVQRRRTRKKRKPRKDGEKVTTTKIVLFSILFTYFAAFALAMYIVICKDTTELSNLLTFVGGATVFAVAFYCWKAKAENLEKIRKSAGLDGTLSDYSNLTSQ